MPDAQTCPSCGAAIAGGSPEGLCPGCLIRSGLSLLHSPATPATDATVPGAEASGRFGNYELLDEIARGGMGVVYRARQVPLNRIVAVKILLFGEFASEEFVRRFKAEAEAAASLKHPNIVALHEVGEHAGQHYFSMDLIEGKDLAEVARHGPLAARTAATIIGKVSRAIHHAHQHGVIHRDLKPSNVLIDVAGEPHVTDFGLAKRLAGDGDLTTTGQVLGSPHFMPPEQADPKLGRPGPAGDIYSLGALLYHLLTGRPPFVGESIEATLRQLLQQEPVSPRLLNASIPLDLETICLKCLQKEPARRYPTAQALADDLGRFLRLESIVARPLGPREKLLRWCQREPALAALTFSLGTVLLTGLLVTTGLLWRERAARMRATEAEQAQSRLRLQVEAQKDVVTSEAAKARQLADFLQQMLTRAGPSASLGRDTTLLREILDQTARRIDLDLTNQPAVTAELRDTIGRTYRDIGDLQKSIAMHREAWRLRHELGDEKSAAAAMTLSLLAQALTEHDELDEAEKLVREALALWRTLRGETDEKVARALTCLGSIYSRRGDLRQAKEHFERALAIHRGNHDSAAYGPLNNLANVLTRQKDYAGAEKVYREAMIVVRQKYGDQHPETALILRNLGDVLNAQGKLDEAAALHSEALAVRAGLLDEVHPLLADSFERLGVVKSQQQQWADAEALFRKAITIRRKLSPNDPGEWGDDVNALAEALNAQSRFDETDRVLAEILAATRGEDPRVARLHAIRGSARGRGGHWAEAIPHLLRAQQLDPTNEWYYLLLAPPVVEARNLPAYQTLCRQSLEHFAEAASDTADHIALINLLSPDSAADLQVVHALIDRALGIAMKRGGNAYYTAVKALAEYRSRLPDRAIQRLETLLDDLDAGRMQAGRFVRVQAHAILAMAHHSLGHLTKAGEALNQAKTVAPPKTQIPPNGDYGGSWHEWLILQIHLREASSLIEGAPATISP